MWSTKYQSCNLSNQINTHSNPQRQTDQVLRFHRKVISKQRENKRRNNMECREQEEKENICPKAMNLYDGREFGNYLWYNEQIQTQSGY